MVEEGRWTAQRPQGAAPRAALERLMATLVNKTVVDHCTSDFEPLLALGYGAGQAACILAEAYVLIARRHAAAGNLSFARRSATYAASLDPLNLGGRSFAEVAGVTVGSSHSPDTLVLPTSPWFSASGRNEWVSRWYDDCRGPEA